MFVFIGSYLSTLVPVLVNVAFFTLLERKILGLSQARKGPNKVSIGGVLQPFADAVKLFLKESFCPTASNPSLYFLAPVVAIFLVLLIWSLAPSRSAPLGMEYSSLIFLVILSLGLYPLLLAGWASNSKYAFVGAMRGVAQTISYEIGLAIILLSFLVSAKGHGLVAWMSGPFSYSMATLMAPLMTVWVVSCVAETNRTPFDFAEGESELVSGFNIEYGAGGFALIFMAEYASILFLSLVTAAIFLSGESLSAETAFASIALAYGWVWLRATFPRYRYDMLMSLAWKSVLPAALILLLFFLLLCKFT